MKKAQTLPIEHVQAMAVDLARRSFYAYCRLRVPKLYTPAHTYLREMCDTLQAFVENKLLKPDGKPYDKLMILTPPRHGKTLTIINLCQWLLGVNTETSIMSVSYNETLSTRAAKAVRDGIQERKFSSERLVYSDFFPGTKIKAGDASMNVWSLEDRHFSYLASSPGGTLTGIGSTVLVVDDLVKNWREACTERILEEHWDFYQNTLLSRLESGAKQIIINTRWADGDISGRKLAEEPGEWYVIKYKACIDEKTKKMLAPDILSFEEFDRRRKTGDAQLISSNYQQETYQSGDLLYGKLRTYDPELLPTGGQVEAYFDTADEGQDYLAGAVYRVAGNTAYVLDVLYTQAPMEITEGKAASMLAANGCKKAVIESNNGGRGFSRNVERILRQVIKYTSCKITWFHQGNNKMARILSTATNVVNCVLMPPDWAERWPEFYRHVTKASRGQKMAHDDFADMLAGIVEKSLGEQSATIPKTNIRRRIGI
jgi:predicted phage terminase large subunit-like protein